MNECPVRVQMDVQRGSWSLKQSLPSALVSTLPETRYIFLEEQGCCTRQGYEGGYALLKAIPLLSRSLVDLNEYFDMPM
jgi:hypothetical protein